MLIREKPACSNCPYKPLDLQLTKGSTIHGVKSNIVDIDFLWEVGKRFEVIAELKDYRNGDSYNYFYLPAHQYVVLKKLAICLGVDSYFIVRCGGKFFIHKIDVDDYRHSVKRFGKSIIMFHRSEFEEFSHQELREFLIRNYVRADWR